MKKILLSVSFGTAMPEAIQRDILPVEEAYAAAFPDREVRRVFTSATVRRTLAEDGLPVPSLCEAIEQAKEEGNTQIAVAANLISPGDEYNRMTADAAGYNVSKPLLDTADDFRKISSLFGAYQKRLGKPIVLMGHGSKNGDNRMYAALSGHLTGPVYIACMDGEHGLNDLLPRLTALAQKELVLIPFLLVAAAHVTVDMLGDGENSWASILKSKGFSVSGERAGLGSRKEIQTMLVEKVRASLM